MLHRGHTVSKLNSRPQTLPSSFLQLGHRPSLRLASFMVSRLHRFRPTSPLPTQPPTMRNGARSRLWRLRRKQPTEILKGQPTPRFTIVTAWGERLPSYGEARIGSPNESCFSHGTSSPSNESWTIRAQSSCILEQIGRASCRERG